MDNELLQEDLIDEDEFIDDNEVEDDDESIEEPETEEEIDEEDQEEEEHFYTQDQVEAAIKTRVSTFNRKLDKMKPYETAVKKICELTGLDVNTLIGRLEGMSDFEQAKILGITPQQLAQQKQLKQTQKSVTEQAQKLQRELDEQKLMADPKYKDYPLFKEEIYEIMDDNPKLTIKQAYILAKGDLGTKAAVRDAEQRAIAKMTKSSNQKVVKPGSTGGKSAPKLDKATISAAKRVGMDPAEYAAYANMTSLEDYERMKSKKKGK
jgi:hypothetical protein